MGNGGPNGSYKRSGERMNGSGANRRSSGVARSFRASPTANPVGDRKKGLVREPRSTRCACRRIGGARAGFCRRRRQEELHVRRAHTHPGLARSRRPRAPGLPEPHGQPTGIDGQFGRGTWRAVRRWERAASVAVRRPRHPRRRQAPARQRRRGRAGRGRAPAARPTSRSRRPPSGPTARRSRPASAPEAVKAIIAAGNEIRDKPYRYGGGHGDFEDSGYDCSGSVSYALHGANLIDRPMDSSGFMSWARSGRGTWVTTYANSGHMYLVVAGLRFDTSGAKSRGGNRWTSRDALVRRLRRPAPGRALKLRARAGQWGPPARA